MNWLSAFGYAPENVEKSQEFLAPEKDADAAKPSLFQGTGEALADIPGAIYYQSSSSLNDLLSFKAEAQNEYELNEDPFAPEDVLQKAKDNKEAFAQRLREDAKYMRLKAKNDWTPNPETTGAAAQIIHSMGVTVGQAIGHTLVTGNPVLGGISFGADRGLYTRGELLDKGVDADTAAQAGAVAGVFEGLGLLIPGSVGSSYWKSMLFGAAVNPAADVGENSTIQFILNNANYQKISKDYEPFDPTNLAVSAGMGMIFGAVGAKAKRRAQRILEREDAQNSSQQTEAEASEEKHQRMNQAVLDSIQNRDRTTTESKFQMLSIAQNPDFNRLRSGAMLGEGAPVVAYLPDNSSAILGKREIVSASDGRRMEMRFAVMEARDVLASNSADGSRNRDFTNPEIEKARAIAGNGRVAGLQGAYREVKATNYRKELTDSAKDYGISKRAIKRMKEPILVRVMEDKDVTLDIGEISNRSGIAKLGAAEQAAQDARNVDLSTVTSRQDGELTNESIEAFVKATPDKEGLLNAKGEILYDNARTRLRPAIFASDYGGTSLIDRFISTNDKEKKTLNLLMEAAPEVVKLRKIGGSLNYADDIVNAVADFFSIRKETKGKIQGEQTTSLFESTPAQDYFKEILLSTRPERLADVMKRLREVAEQEQTDNMFGEALTKDQILEAVKNEFGAFDKAVESIEPSHVDAAMELNSANVIQGDQPVGKNGNVNASLADERLAGEQIDDGKKVEVSGDGVDPEVMDKNVSSFVTRFVKELLGIHADRKLAEMNAAVVDAFYRTLGVRLGKSRKEIESEYGLMVRKEDRAVGGFNQGGTEPLVRAGIIRKPDSETAKVERIPEGLAPNFEKMQDFSDWAKRILQSGGDVTIQSTGQVARFTAKNVRASTKRSRSKVHRDAYPALRNLIENAEYDHYEPADERHPNGAGQDVYYSALSMSGKLYSVKIKLDVVPEVVKRLTSEHGEDTGDVRYKDHKLTEIEIAPTLYRTILPSEGVHSQQEGAINKVSLGILRGNVKPTRLKDGVLYQSAYHGSPHLFDTFSTDFIGSGEGAQAHGWGLYFAQDKKVAENYRRKLTGQKFIEDFEKKFELRDNIDYEDLIYEIHEEGRQIDPKYQRVIDAVQKESRFGFDGFRQGLMAYLNDPIAFEYSEPVDKALAQYDGRLFELDIPETKNMLDEQLPFDKQPPEVQDGIRKLLVDQEGEAAADIDMSRVTGKRMLKYLEDVARYSGERNPQKWAALKLNEYGIKGISYDGKRDGRCFVVFDDKAVKIMEYYQKNDQADSAPKGIYTPGERVVTLMQSADESTFVHESGHYFLDVLTDIGNKDDAPKQIKDDIQTLMNWFGVQDLDEWNSLSFEGRRQYHEKFARGFEQYLREGEAPSTALEKVFNAFKEWLRKIYKSARDLDVEITPEVRAVYDRLLATDEEIKTKREADTPSMIADFEEEAPKVDEVTKTAAEIIEQAPIPEEAKSVIKSTLGIEEPTKAEAQKKGIPTEDEFVTQSLESNFESDPNAFITDDSGNEISIKEFLAEQNRIADDEINDAMSKGVAAECMWHQGAFDDL